MTTNIRIILDGSITSAAGFRAGVNASGIKNTSGALDLGLIVSDYPANSAALFTSNRFCAAPVIVSTEHLKSEKISAIVVNSGCANAGTGKTGYQNALEMTKTVAELLNISISSVLVASTGVIGVQLPIGNVIAGIQGIDLQDIGGHAFAKAIMTTDLVPKEIAVTVPEFGFTVGACAKGSGMIHPDMATMLGFITTDIGIDSELLRKTLKQATDKSFNLISVDGDTSTNDSVFIMANGASGVAAKPGTEAIRAFAHALEYVCIHLAKEIARDGEGATKLIEIHVDGATSYSDARKVIRTVLSSALVKTAVHGSDPNWGRIIAAVGRSGAEFQFEKIKLRLGVIDVVRDGKLQSFDKKQASQQFQGNEVFIFLDMGLGKGEAIGWGCDMSAEYVRINADYTT